MRSFWTVISIVVVSCAPGLGGTLDNRNPTLSVRAVDVYAAYEKNGLAAQQQYKDKRVSIGGEVKEVAEDRDGAPYLLLRGEEHSFTGVKCRFAPESMQRLSTLKPGNRVVVHGTVEGRKGSSGHVVIADCRFP